jgi:hypothetical protein
MCAAALHIMNNIYALESARDITRDSRLAVANTTPTAQAHRGGDPGPVSTHFHLLLLFLLIVVSCSRHFCFDVRLTLNLPY